MSISGQQIAKGRVKQASLTAVVTRADGTVEHLDLAFYHRNPLRRALWRIINFITRRRLRP